MDLFCDRLACNLLSVDCQFSGLQLSIFIVGVCDADNLILGYYHSFVNCGVVLEHSDSLPLRVVASLNDVFVG